ncbi:MAG: hypothetical protein JXB62_08945 [Pirellulales bacterium]|nr:hypothetical protein [Pirellulales bacterium]
MHSQRGIAAVLLSGTLAVAAAAGAAWVFWPGLPDPAVADRDGLFRWLVLRDLSNESPETQTLLAQRLEDEFSEGLDWESVGGKLDETQRTRLWGNILVLIEPWLKAKMEHYFALASAERGAYVDRFIDTISAWRGADSLRPEQGHNPDGGGGIVSVVFEETEKWKKQADPQRRERISQFLLAVQARWLLRNLRQLAPAGD